MVETPAGDDGSFAWALADTVAGGDTFIGWCLRASDLDAIAARLDLPVEKGGRTLPDGEILRWRLAGRNAATAYSWLPFFISWEVTGDRHPGRGRTSHRTPYGDLMGRVSR